ncbi:14058_t:CDS:2, partial [Ambispora leptoticha]
MLIGILEGHWTSKTFQPSSHSNDIFHWKGSYGHDYGLFHRESAAAFTKGCVRQESLLEIE